MRIKRARSGLVDVQLDAVEVAVLRAAVADLAALVSGATEPGRDGGGEVDPLEALVGLSSAQTPRPDDPALQRLLPDAYREDAFPADLVDDRTAAASAASAEFRRFTEADLRAGKRADAEALLATLAPLEDEGGRLRLDRDQADHWLGALNDLRLVLGVRLDVDEDSLDEPLPDDDPRAAALHLYAWLGYVQESLLGCLEPRGH